MKKIYASEIDNDVLKSLVGQEFKIHSAVSDYPARGERMTEEGYLLVTVWPLGPLFLQRVRHGTLDLWDSMKAGGRERVSSITLGYPYPKDKNPLYLVVPWGKPYGPGPHYVMRDGKEVTMYRKGQKVRFYDQRGNQVGPEQANVAPAVAYAHSQSWRSLTLPSKLGGAKPNPDLSARVRKLKN